MNKFKDFDETIKDLETSFEDLHLSVENIFIANALDRVLAQNIIAQENSPEFETSGMDGYAIRFEDQNLGKISFAEDLPAGTYKEDVLISKGTCIKTFTGSLMSKGSDTLIPIENVNVSGNEIIIKEKVPKGFAVRPIGENYKECEVLIKKGTTIGFAEIGVMAELALVQVEVFSKPRVAILATGSEILDLGEPKTSVAQIRSSNHVTIEGIVQGQGAVVSRLAIARDDKEIIKEKIANALLSHDIVITTGGVSVGDYDFVKEILKGMKPEYIVDGAFVKPGRHIKIVKIGSKFIFALPGFPYSSAVMAFLYVLPLISYMQGKSSKSQYLDAIIKEDYTKRSKFTEFTACNLYLENGQFFVDLKNKKMGSSAILTNMLHKSALLRIEKDEREIKIGQSVKVLPMSNLF